jgi:hypothetical protein
VSLKILAISSTCRPCAVSNNLWPSPMMRQLDGLRNDSEQNYWPKTEWKKNMIFDRRIVSSQSQRVDAFWCSFKIKGNDTHWQR